MLPAVLILLWLIGAAIGGPYFGKVDEVSSNDQTSYLPASADATRVQGLLQDFRDSNTIPAVVVFVAENQFTDTQTSQVRTAVESLAEIPGVADGVSPLLPSEDGLAMQVFVPIDSEADVSDAVVEISEYLHGSKPTGIEAYVTGPPGFSAELVRAFSGIDGLLLAVALIAVMVILIFVYRSLLLPIAVLSTSVVALTVALLTVWWLAKAEVLLLSGQTQF